LLLKSESDVVIPASAGIHLRNSHHFDNWIPAFAGMTR
jgi:hypothetical protein